jgi:hypothetical protein
LKNSLKRVLDHTKNQYVSRGEVIQVAFSVEEAERVRANAELLGLSQSAYVRRIVMSTLEARAWWAPPFEGEYRVGAVRSHGVHLMRTTNPHFYLERVGDGGAEYRVFNASRVPLTFAELESLDMFPQLHQGRLMIAGSNDLWSIEESIEDAHLRGQLRWRLAMDRRLDSERFTPQKRGMESATS